MDDKKLFQQKTSRRTFLKQSATALAMATILPSALTSCTTKEKKHDCSKCTAAICSKFNGVQIGAITYSWRSMPAKDLDTIIAYCKEANLSSLELMGGDLEMVLGVPENPTNRIMAELRAKMTPPKPGERPKRPEFTAEHKAEIEKYNQDLKAWRVGMDMAKVEAVRKKFNEAGIYFGYHNHVHEFKLADDGKMFIDHILDNCEEKNVFFEMDTRHVALSEVKPEKYIKKMPGRVKVLHARDTNGENDTAVGAGIVDFKAVMDVIGVPEWFVVENENFGKNEGELADSVTYLKNTFGK